jgi:uncharacterized iron-regulated membrane protein
VPASKRSHWWRWLYIVHRWVGIVTCLLFAIWFVSGLVMVYVPFPALSRAERLAGLEPIDWPQVRLQPTEALQAAGILAPPRMMALEMRGDRAVWRIDPWDGPRTTVSATDGRAMGFADRQEATRTAAAFAGAPVRTIEQVERDQWTVPGSFDRHRPLWKASLSGPSGRVLYVSSSTGTVVLDTNANERFWNWLGSVPHWIYPTVLRQDNAAWRQVVMWISGPCIVGAVTGMWIGVLRTRLGRRRFKGGRVTPYRGWMEWHHVSGLIGGTFLVAWIFSGWLSVDPFRLFASEGISQERVQSYAGATMPGSLDLATLALRAPGAKRIVLEAAAGRPLLTIERSEDARTTLDADTLTPPEVDQPTLVRSVRGLVPGAPVLAAERLDAPDAYWYAVGERPVLPVLRIRFGDAAGTWVHVDPATGHLLGDLDRRRRLYRWMFDLLHKWDLNVLTLHRPVWDVLLWVLSLLGLVTSITGIRVGWARLRRGKAAEVR